MNIHLVNPSDTSFGTAVITPRWLYVMATATAKSFENPEICDETLEHLNLDRVQPGDVVGIGIHTGNALRGYEVGRAARDRGAWVVFGGIHSTLYSEEPFEHGGAHVVVKGDGDIVWNRVLRDCAAGTPERIYNGGKVEPEDFQQARWDLLPANSYMWASVQTVRGCAKHCSFCSVWRTDGQRPRQRATDSVIEEIVELRRRGFRFIALADDNFYPVTLTDIELAKRQNNQARVDQLQAMREERFELMERLSELPKDITFFTQITMEAAEGLKSVYKDFNLSGENLVNQLKRFSDHGVHVLGSFIFGLPSDRPDTFDATHDLAQRAGLTFAQFVMLTPFPGTVDFEKWEKAQGESAKHVDGIPLTRYWLIPAYKRPKMFMPHPNMSPEERREH